MASTIVEGKTKNKNAKMLTKEPMTRVCDKGPVARQEWVEIMYCADPK